MLLIFKAIWSVLLFGYFSIKLVNKTLEVRQDSCLVCKLLDLLGQLAQ